jgi:hypothetical protein
MQLTIELTILGILFAAVLALAIARKRVAGNDDEMLHVRDTEASLVNRQIEVARKLEVLDRWGKAVTAIAVIYGVVVLARLLYMVWEQGQHLSAN